MTRPRSSLVSLSDTPWYHVVNRCVRRAFLCGQDQTTGQNFDHHRGWIETRIRELASVFTIDVAAYAVMTKRDIFSELVEGFDALKSEREGKVTLRQVNVAAHPAPVLAPQDVLAVREKLNLSRTVFARYLRTNPRTLENWEECIGHPLS